MKKLENLDSKLPHPDPDPNPEIAERQQADIASYRRLLRLTCMNVRAQNVNEADACDQVRMKLSQVESTVLVEDSEFKALMERVERNEMAWPNWMFSEVLRYLREASKKKVDVEEKVPA